MHPTASYSIAAAAAAAGVCCRLLLLTLQTAVPLQNDSDCWHQQQHYCCQWLHVVLLLVLEAAWLADQVLCCRYSC
jgi:hypothetical protein